MTNVFHRMKHSSVCAGLVLIAFAAGCESKSLGNSVGQAGTGGPGGAGGTGDPDPGGSGGTGGSSNPGGTGGTGGSANPGGAGGTFSSCDGIGGSAWVTGAGTAGSDGDNGLLFASAGGPGTGDPCTPEGCPETVATGQSSPWSIAVDGGNLYWSSFAGLMRMPFGGTPAVITSDSNSTFAIDASSVYWVSLSGRAIMKGPLQGGAAVQLVDRSSVVALPIDDLALDRDFLYWAEYRPCLGVLMKIAKEGGGPAVIASSNQQAPGPLAVDATNLYGSSGGVGLFKIPLAGGAPVVLAADGAYNLALTTDTVVWSGGNGLQKVPIAGGAPVGIATQVWGPIATDGKMVFWGRVGGSVMATPLDGGPDKVLANYQYPRGIAVDATNVYWTSQHNTVMKIPRR